MSQAIPSEAPVEDFGPVLLEQRVAQPDAVATLGVGVVCLIAGIILMAVGARGFDGSLSFTLGLGAFLGLLGSVIFIVTFRTYASKRGTRQFVSERGLIEGSAREVISIGYDDADELEYRVTDMHHNGIYRGTFDHFALRTTGSPGKEIIYKGPCRKREDPTPFPPIVEAIAARLAGRMAEAVGRGESVRWTSKMTIHPGGLTLEPRPWGLRPGLALSKEIPERVAWGQIDHIDFNQGICQVWLKGGTSARLIVEAGEPNFHPGYRTVMEILHDRAARRPAAPVRGLAHGEKITVEYAHSIEVRFDLERAAFLVNPKAQKESREIRFIVALLFPVLAAGMSLKGYFQGNFGVDALLMRLFLCALGGVAAYAAIEVWNRLSTRRKVYREARLAQERYQSGQGPDPDYRHQVTLGPPGFSCRMPGGEFQRPWSEVSRVLWDRGSIIICRPGTGVEPESVAVLLPAIAFEDPRRAHDAFRRITEWHRAASTPTAAP